MEFARGNTLFVRSSLFLNNRGMQDSKNNNNNPQKSTVLISFCMTTQGYRYTNVTERKFKQVETAGGNTCL